MQKQKHNLSLYKIIAFSLFATTLLYGVASNSVAISSPSFHMDFEGITTGSDDSKSPDYQMQSGFASIQTNSLSPSFQVSTINLIDVCGNGIIELNEVCDSTNFNGKTCSDFGFTSGNLSCVSCSSISSTACFTPGPGGGTGGGGVVLPITTKPKPPTSSTETSENPTVEDPMDNENNLHPVPDEDVLITQPNPENPIITPNPNINNKPDTPTPTTETPPVVPPTNQQVIFPICSVIENNQTIDDTPIIADNFSANTKYIVSIVDNLTRKILFESEIISDSKGNIIFETPMQLAPGVYKYSFYDTKRKTTRTYTYEVLYRLYPEIQISEFATVKSPDTEMAKIRSIDLGKIYKSDDMTILGKTAPNTRLDSFFESSIVHVRTFSDNLGNFEIPIPDELSLGKHSLTLIQQYPDNTLSDDLQFEFTLVDNNICLSESSNFLSINCILIILLIISLLTYAYLFHRKQKKSPKIKKRIKKLSKEISPK